MIQTEELLATVTRPAAWFWIQRRYLQAGPTCPACGESITGARALAAWNDLRRVYCASCGHTFRPTTGTPIADTSWQPEEFVQLLYLVGAGRQPGQIAPILGKSAACVRDMIERFRLHHAAAPAGQASSSDQPLTAQG